MTDAIRTLTEWQQVWQGSGQIQDEYGSTVTAIGMLDRITNRASDRAWDAAQWPLMGYATEREFHDRNGSERGPNNLLRQRIGRFCIEHGDGTWDYIDGDFG